MSIKTTSDVSAPLDMIKDLNDQTVIPLFDGKLKVSGLGAAVGILATSSLVGGAVGGAIGGYFSTQDGNDDDDDDETDPTPDPGTDPAPEPDPDPSPDPDPDPTPEPTPDPTTLELFLETKGSWSENGAGPHLEIKIVDSYVSLAVVGRTTEVLSIGDLRQYLPNNVRFVNATRVALDSQMAVSYGLNTFDAITIGHELIDTFLSGFFLVSLINRDEIVAGVNESLMFTTVYQASGWGASFRVDTHTNTSVNGSTVGGGTRGEAAETRRYKITGTFALGSTIDGSGGITPINTLGDFCREVAAGTQGWTIPETRYWYAPVNNYGRAVNKRIVHPLISTNVIAESLRSAFDLDVKKGDPITLKELVLRYVDDPAIRPIWDGHTLVDFPFVREKFFLSHVAPFLEIGTDPL